MEVLSLSAPARYLAPATPSWFLLRSRIYIVLLMAIIFDRTLQLIMFLLRFSTFRFEVKNYLEGSRARASSSSSVLFSLHCTSSSL